MRALDKMKALLLMAPAAFKVRRDVMVTNSIRVGDFLYWFVSHYPESRQILLKQPEYLLTFK